MTKSGSNPRWIGAQVALIACIGSLLIHLPIQASEESVSTPSVPVSAQLSKFAHSITVKVLSGDTWGSGILIQRQGQVYTVLTNQHVLTPGEGKRYRIQTADGRIYPASLPAWVRFEGNDLGLLQFKSANTSYAVASLGDSSKLKVGDEVFASGFPVEAVGYPPNPTPVATTGENPRQSPQVGKPLTGNASLRLRLTPVPYGGKPSFRAGLTAHGAGSATHWLPLPRGGKDEQYPSLPRGGNAELHPPLIRQGKGGFVFTTGQISLLMQQPFGGGYQIGYTNPIQKGMSGGPLLNRQGMVVGINGMHQYPLWGNPYVFKDGSTPSVAMQEQMSQFSWAVPVRTFLQLAGQFADGKGVRSFSPINLSPTPEQPPTPLPAMVHPNGYPQRDGHLQRDRYPQGDSYPQAVPPQRRPLPEFLW